MNRLLDRDNKQHPGDSHGSPQPPRCSHSCFFVSTPRVTPPVTRVTLDSQGPHLRWACYTWVLHVCRTWVWVHIGQQELKGGNKIVGLFFHLTPMQFLCFLLDSVFRKSHELSAFHLKYTSTPLSITKTFAKPANKHVHYKTQHEPTCMTPSLQDQLVCSWCNIPYDSTCYMIALCLSLLIIHTISQWQHYLTTPVSSFLMTLTTSPFLTVSWFTPSAW